MREQGYSVGCYTRTQQPVFSNVLAWIGLDRSWTDKSKWQANGRGEYICHQLSSRCFTSSKQQPPVLWAR
ncbi:hypothetical protein DAI22_07g270300 [Oryza sativa Japonica Group]|nr:hypothetical protein DAI22_07g270300 [Oryza sativa Japonica Group]